MLLCAGHQPNFWPYGGFFAKMDYADIFVIADNLQYVKKEYHNRNRIKLANGKEKWLTVPVINKGRLYQKINEAEINYTSDWVSDHLNSIKFQYQKAPYFDLYFEKIEEIYRQKFTKLFDLNFAIINFCKNELNISTETKLSSEMNAEGKASEFIKAITLKSGCDSYLHGIHSLDYVDFKLLEQNKITSFIQTYTQQNYPQINGEFLPNLATLDILMNCGDKALELINKGNLVQSHREMT